MVFKKVKPKTPGSIVRFPVDGRILPQDGDIVPMTQYWSRRLRFGDVVEVESDSEPQPVEEPVEDKGTGKRKNK